MFEVVLDCVKYVKDVPLELTDKAFDEGRLGKYTVLGLLVHPVQNPDNQVLIDLKLSDDGQIDLIKPGNVLPVEGRGTRYCLSPNWREYNIRQKSSG